MQMTPTERTLRFIRGETVDRPPFHPIVMRWAARYAGVPYGKFCLDYRAKCEAMLRCADDFEADWVTVMSDPYCEAEAFGVEIEYPEDGMPIERGGHPADARAVAALPPYRPLEHARCRGRIEEIREFRRLRGEQYFIVGWVEGPVAEYADLRGVSATALDLYDDPEAVHQAMDLITACALEFITLQIEAGAHCIGIGDAFCSQLGPNLYREFAFAREKQMVDHAHRLGALAKLHICGNTAALLPDMIKTGADIVDVDHLVPSMQPFAPLLGPAQVLSGKCDPVTVIENGTAAQITACARESDAQAGGRCIVSAGCEITPDTSAANLHAFARAMRA
ncbi:MAG: uroporphyrinogen decarboxylase family protein [Candidatus Marinimicrobia bacterium]|nr:uroporphyrinogen decarboxylase family protein [Candidatus Neomarinimicrobiota bacterium]